MAEFRRCVLNRKNSIILLILLVINLAFCTMQCNDTQQITKTGEELQAYLDYYPEYLINTLQNAEDLQLLNFFGDKNTFSARNLEKTVSDFASMQEVTLDAGENRGVVLLTNFELTDLLLVGYGIYLILLFTGEYRKGLNFLTFSTRNGRHGLGLQRMGILFGSLAFVAALLYGTNLVVVNAHYPGMASSRALQSVPEFMKCTLHLTIGQYLAILYVMRYLAVCLIALFLFACMSVTKSTVGGIAAGTVMAVEVLLYRLMLSTSVMNGFKFLNIYALLKNADAFYYYCNLNLFGHPVQMLTAQLATWGIASVLCIAAITFAQGMKPLEGGAWIRQLADRIVKWIQQRKVCLPPILWEGRKILVGQYGLLIMIVFFYLAISSAVSTQYRDFRDKAQALFYEQYGGEITEEKMAQIKKAEAKMIKYYNNAGINIERYQEAQRQGYQGDEKAYAESLRVQAEYDLKIPAIQAVRGNMESCYEYMQEHKATLTLMEPFAYNMLFKNDAKTTNRNRLYILLCLVVLFSGIMNYEKQSNMNMLLHTLPNGRRTVIRYKAIWVIILSVLFALPVCMIQFIRIGKVFPYENLSGLIQSLELYRTLPLQISIRWFLIGVYAVKCLLAAGFGLFVTYVGSKCKNRVNCIAVCTVAVLVGTFLLT